MDKRSIWVIERKIGNTSPQYMDAFGDWCECTKHAKTYLNRQRATWALADYLKTCGAENILYQVTKHTIID